MSENYHYIKNITTKKCTKIQIWGDYSLKDGRNTCFCAYLNEAHLLGSVLGIREAVYEMSAKF